uniref:Uncharacterized protein n=1 Tax=Plectus sambesii TaxID=2011161 RepID=A0A914VLJ6_9BILA
MNDPSNEILAECSDDEAQNGARLQDPFALTPTVDAAKALFNQLAVEGPEALINQIQCIKRLPQQQQQAPLTPQQQSFAMKAELIEQQPS